MQNMQHTISKEISYSGIGLHSGKDVLMTFKPAKENNGILVCSNPSAMHSKALAYGLTGFDIISYKDYFESNYDFNKKTYIDELEIFVKYLIGDDNFSGYTLSIGD